MTWKFPLRADKAAAVATAMLALGAASSATAGGGTHWSVSIHSPALVVGAGHPMYGYGMPPVVVYMAPPPIHAAPPPRPVYRHHNGRPAPRHPVYGQVHPVRRTSRPPVTGLGYGPPPAQQWRYRDGHR